MRFWLSIACALVTAIASSPVGAQSENDRGAVRARQAVGETSTGPLRSASREAVGGAIYANTNAGAGAGAVIVTANHQVLPVLQLTGA
jgi:hypothetical protein